MAVSTQTQLAKADPLLGQQVGRRASKKSGLGCDDLLLFNLLRAIPRLHREPRAPGIEPPVAPRQAPEEHGAASGNSTEANGVDRRQSCAMPHAFKSCHRHATAPKRLVYASATS